MWTFASVVAVHFKNFSHDQTDRNSICWTLAISVFVISMAIGKRCCAVMQVGAVAAHLTVFVNEAS